MYQNTFLPRTGTNQSNRVIRIMSTNTNEWPDRSKEFKVNHFVPLLRKHHDENAAEGWKFVTEKRKQKESLQKEGKKISPSEPANNPTPVKLEGVRKYEDKFKIRVKSEGMVKHKRVESNFKPSKGSTAQQNGTKLTSCDEYSKETDIEKEKKKTYELQTASNGGWKH